jgi:hypothetical protein
MAEKPSDYGVFVAVVYVVASGPRHRLLKTKRMLAAFELREFSFSTLALRNVCRVCSLRKSPS